MPQIRNAADFQSLGTVHNRAVAQLNLIDEETKTIPFILVSNDNGGLRYDWWEDEIYREVLDVNGADFSELNTFFKDHHMSVDTAIGRVVNKRIENGKIKADVIFGSDENAQNIFRKFKEGILTDVSIGYSILETVTTEKENDYPEVRVTKFNIHELSAVWKGFDKKAKVGREAINLEEEVKSNDESERLKAKRSRDIWLAEKL